MLPPKDGENLALVDRDIPGAQPQCITVDARQLTTNWALKMETPQSPCVLVVYLSASSVHITQVEYIVLQREVSSHRAALVLAPPLPATETWESRSLLLTHRRTPCIPFDLPATGSSLQPRLWITTKGGTVQCLKLSLSNRNLVPSDLHGDRIPENFILLHCNRTGPGHPPRPKQNGRCGDGCPGRRHPRMHHPPVSG